MSLYRMNSTLAEVLERLTGKPLLSEENREKFGALTVYQYWTFLAEGAPQGVERGIVPFDRYQWSLADTVARLTSSNGPRYVRDHGPAPMPKFLQDVSPRKGGPVITEKRRKGQSDLTEAAAQLFDRPGSPDLDHVDLDEAARVLGLGSGSAAEIDDVDRLLFGD